MSCVQLAKVRCHNRWRRVTLAMVATFSLICLLRQFTHVHRIDQKPVIKPVAKPVAKPMEKPAANRPKEDNIAGLDILHYCCNGRFDTYDSTDVFISTQMKYTDRISKTLQLPTVCISETCRAAYVKHFQRTDAFPIPAIRHILWRNESVSKYFAEQLRSWQILHPDWTYVLWRDEDMIPFVATHFPGLLDKFKALYRHIMRVDMIRYMLLFKYGGIYADLDYSLVRSLDSHRRFHAVVTREPEAHSLLFRSMSWPVKPLTNPAFLMSAPGHPFFLYVIQQLMSFNLEGDNVLGFAGPFGLTCIMENYLRLFPVAPNAMATVYVPPSRSFYPYQQNRINTSNTDTVPYRLGVLERRCKTLMSSKEPEMQCASRNPHMREFCADVNNMDAITDKSDPVFAVHDLQKTGGIWYSKVGDSFYASNLIDIRLVLRNVTFGTEFFQSRS